MSPSVPPVVVATHGHCFDGMASAVLFSSLVREVDGALRGAPFVYRGQSYDPGRNGVDATIFEGAASSAILDFRYTSTDALGWYFDHHASAFPSAHDRAHFDRLASKRRGFYDAEYGSCARLIADVAQTTFGLDFSRFGELVHWANMIDTASFPSPELAVDRSEPEMKLLAVIEQQGNDRLLSELVRSLDERPLHEVATSPEITERYAAIDGQYRAQVARIRAHEERRGEVVWVDLLDAPLATVTKFVTYADVPDAPYSVIASRSDQRCKISVGYNPWCGKPRRHDISKICERYGGGGHAVVGAIALPLDMENCRTIGLSIVDELQT